MTVYLEVEGTEDNLGRTPFTVYWKGNSEVPFCAQCFRTNLKEFKTRHETKGDRVIEVQSQDEAWAALGRNPDMLMLISKLHLLRVEKGRPLFGITVTNWRADPKVWPFRRPQPYVIEADRFCHYTWNMFEGQTPESWGEILTEAQEKEIVCKSQ